MSLFTHVWALAGYILPFLFVLSLVVFFHELGHFLIGRWCGVKVDTFSLGFGPELFGFNDRYGTTGGLRPSRWRNGWGQGNRQRAVFAPHGILRD